MHLCYGSARVDTQKARHIRGELLIPGGDATVKFELLPLHPVRRLACLSLALPALRGIQLQQYGCVGLQLTCSELIAEPDLVERKSTSSALVCQRRKLEAVSNHDVASCQTGPDDLFNERGPRGQHQEQLAPSRHRKLHASEHGLADSLTQGGGARLSRDHDAVAACPQGVGEQADLRAFPRSFDTLERKEKATLARPIRGR